MKNFAKAAFFALALLMMPVIHVSAAFDVFTATFDAQVEVGVSAAHDENAEAGISIRYDENASVGFSIGSEAIIFMTFDEPTTFASNLVFITTNIPALSRADAESANARIISLYADAVAIDGISVNSIPAYAGDGQIDTWLRLHSEYEFTEIEPFSSLMLTFVVENLPLGIEDDEYDEPTDYYDDYELSLGPVEPETVNNASETDESGGFLIPTLVIVVLLAVGCAIFLAFRKKK
ncbi:MAG: hypothetical protein FWC70_00465 [Defluviitaleaceae bacterium]|nr:hypothetical protein [Defluviitaleaceae bacterium]